jgi:hypothetical protein
MSSSWFGTLSGVIHVGLILPPVAMIHKTLSVIWERALCIIGDPTAWLSELLGLRELIAVSLKELGLVVSGNVDRNAVV